MTGTGTQADPYIVENETEFRSVCGNYDNGSKYVKCAEGMEFDYKDNPNILPQFDIYVKELDANGLTIKNGRFDNGIIANSDKSPTINNINILDCVFTGGSSAVIQHHTSRGSSVYMNDSTIRIKVPYKFTNGNGTTHFNSCNITMDARASNEQGLFDRCEFTDCNIFPYSNKSAAIRFGNSHFCYIRGSFDVSQNSSHVSDTSDLIFDLEPNEDGSKHNWDLYYWNPNTKSIVYNSDTIHLVKNSCYHPERITGLSTADIRNPAKLAAAGISINPTG